MTFSTYAGVAIVPTLSRIVLCAAFIPAGYSKVFTETDFTAEEAATLRQKWNVEAAPKQAVARAEQIAGVQVIFAAYRQDPPQTQPDSAGEPPAPRDVPADTAPPPSEAGESDAQPPSDAADEQTAPPSRAGGAPAQATPTGGSTDSATYRASTMHRITLIVDKAGWPEPLWQARIAAWTELVGGLLLAIGLFSRLWGLGLAAVMLAAFYLTTLPALQQAHWSLFALDPMTSNQLFTQASLFVLALGIFMTGPGPLSLDRLLFGGRREVVEVATVKD